MDLKLKISQILTDIDASKRLAGDFEDSDLIDLAETRGMDFSKRQGAIKVLIKKGLKTECHAVARNLTTGINAEEFILLKDILRSFPDANFIEELFQLIIERVTFSEEALRNVFRKFLEDTGLIKTFLELIFLRRSESWEDKNQENIKYLLDDEYLSREIIKFGFERITSDCENSVNLVRRLTIFYPPFVKWILEEVKSSYLFQKASMENEIKKIKKECTVEIEELIQRHEVEVSDAVDKTSQRYEEYLRRLVPILHELKLIRDKIQAKGVAAKLTSIREDIEGLLKLLKVIDRD